MLKKLFYASASVLMLALAYHLGATAAAAQASDPVVAVFWAQGTATVAVTANGNVYTQDLAWSGPWTLRSNVFGSPTPAAQPTWGQLKVQYRK